MWRDMAIYTNTVDRCGAYQTDSQNVKSRPECRFTDDYWENEIYGFVEQNNNPVLPLNEDECLNATDGTYTSSVTNETGLYKYEWVTTPSHGIDAPFCAQSRTTRPNHHGTPGDRSYWTHNWQIPNSILQMEGHEQCCVIRLRYNMTSDEYQAWESDTSIGAGLDAANNSKVNNPNPDDDPAWVRIWEDFGLTFDDIEDSFDANNPEDVADGNPNADDAEQKTSRGLFYENTEKFGGALEEYVINAPFLGLNVFFGLIFLKMYSGFPNVFEVFL